MALYLGSEKIAGNCTSKSESLLNNGFVIENVTSDGSTTSADLTKNVTDFDFVLVISRGDWNSLFPIVIPKECYGNFFNINITNPSNTGYYVRGHVKVEGNKIYGMCTAKAGWAGLGFYKVIGVKL